MMLIQSQFLPWKSGHFVLYFVASLEEENLSAIMIFFIANIFTALSFALQHEFCVEGN